MQKPIHLYRVLRSHDLCDINLFHLIEGIIKSDSLTYNLLQILSNLTDEKLKL